MNPAQGFVRLSLRDLLLLDELAERPADPFHPSVDVLLLDVPQTDIVAVEGGQLRDSVAHLSRADDRDPQFLRRSFRWMGQTALKMWCVPLRKRLCAAGVMENRYRRGPLARSNHHRRDHRGGPRPLPRRPGAPRTTPAPSSKRVPPRDRVGLVPPDRARPRPSRRGPLLEYASRRMAPPS